MTLINILIFTSIASIIGSIVPSRWLKYAIMITNIISIYLLQPVLPIHNLNWWIPSSSIILVLLVWFVCNKNIIFGKKISKTLSSHLSWFLLILIVAIFILMKNNGLIVIISSSLRKITGQDPELASHIDVLWLGYSYLAFRLLHIIRDFQNGRLPKFSLLSTINFSLFLPTYISGPIDRIDRFDRDINSSIHTTSFTSNTQKERLIIGVKRILLGLFKKFVVADSLSLIALNPFNAEQFQSSGWLWLSLYAYSLRIYYDFSGYTDIAIGLGKMFGITLPENFDAPYLKTNLIAFWNSWHITLAQWFRSYFFNPITRWLRTKGELIPTWVIIFVGQISTMILIGLWHGISWNFTIWGLWHGLGLFINNRWSNLRILSIENKKVAQTVKYLLQFGGWLLTFNYVTLGWIWFIVPETMSSIALITKLLSFR